MRDLMIGTCVTYACTDIIYAGGLPALNALHPQLVVLSELPDIHWQTVTEMRRLVELVMAGAVVDLTVDRQDTPLEHRRPGEAWIPTITIQTGYVAGIAITCDTERLLIVAPVDARLDPNRPTTLNAQAILRFA